MYHQPAESSACTSTSSPQGVAFFSASTSRFCTSLGSRLGTSRTPIRAHAESQMMFRASLRLLAWNAFTAIDGCRQFISQGWVPCPSISTPGNIPACFRKCASSPGSAAMLLRSLSVSGFTCSLMPGMAMEPSGLVSEASIRQRPITGSGTGPPHIPE